MPTDTIAEIDSLPNAQNAAENDMTKKQQEWGRVKKYVDTIVDPLGEKVDERIKETVVAFNVLGLTTTQSCEGHIEDKGVRFPYIDVAAPNEPRTKWAKEEQVIEETARKYGIAVEELKSGVNEQASLEENEKTIAGGKTPEHLSWEAANNLLKQKVQQYLDEFYKNREASPEIRLKVRLAFVDRWKVVSGTEKDFFGQTNISEEDARALLLPRQAEMAAFTDFLKNKYFQG